MRLLIAFAVCALVTHSLFAAEKSETKNAQIKFGGITTKPTKLTFGSVIKLEAELKPIDVAKTWGVSVSGKLHNPTDKKMHYSYQIAFFDADKNLIGCQNFTHWVDAGKTVTAGTFISLSADQIDKITSYSAVFYESDQQIGSK
jgi:hypothetical protein